MESALAERIISLNNCLRCVNPLMLTHSETASPVIRYATTWLGKLMYFKPKLSRL